MVYIISAAGIVCNECPSSYACNVTNYHNNNDNNNDNNF
jgi:hypothetical protein